MRKREKLTEILPTESEGSKLEAKKCSFEHGCIDSVTAPCSSISLSQGARSDVSEIVRPNSVLASKGPKGMVTREHRRLSGDNAASAKTLQQVNESLRMFPVQFQQEPVHLPKKIGRVVQPKITSHLRLSAKYAYDIFDGGSRWFNIFKCTWFRLLVVSMAEYGVNFVYTESKDAFRSLSTGDPVLPWIGISRDPRKILPTRSDAEDILECIKLLRELQLTPEDNKELRELIILSGPDADEFLSYTYKYFYTRFCLSRPNFERNMGEVARLGNAIIKLSEMKAEAIAGLLCSHLRGHTSFNAVLSEEMQASVNDMEDHQTGPSNQTSLAPSSVQEQLVNSFMKLTVNKAS
ncbi:hypothetical protein Aperf_G00000059440 [Anoplocephala perfoliata]